MKTIKDMLEQREVPVIALDQEGSVTFVNEPFAREYGWRPEDLRNKSVSAIIPPDMRQAHHLGFSRFLNTGAPTLIGKPLNLPVFCKDGRILPAEHFIVAEKQAGRWSFAAAIRPLKPGS